MDKEKEVLQILLSPEARGAAKKGRLSKVLPDNVPGVAELEREGYIEIMDNLTLIRYTDVMAKLYEMKE